LGKGGGGEDVVEGLAIQEPGGGCAGRGELGDGGLEADGEVLGEVADEAAVAIGVVKAVVARDGGAEWCGDGGVDAAEVFAAGGGDELVEGGVAEGEVLGAVVDAAAVPAFGGATAAATAGFFEDDGVQAGGAEMAGGGDAGEAGADDGDLGKGHKGATMAGGLRPGLALGASGGWGSANEGNGFVCEGL